MVKANSGLGNWVTCNFNECTHREGAFRAVNGNSVLMRIWSVNILWFFGIVAKRSVVNAMKVIFTN